MSAEGRFEGLTRDQAIDLFGSMEKGDRTYAPDWKNRSNKWWHLRYLWRGESVEEQLADKANFEEQGTMRGSKWIPLKVLLNRYVCLECGAHLEAFEASFPNQPPGGTSLDSSIWGLLCQRDPWHSGIERILLCEAREREARSAKAMREMEHVPVAQMFEEMYGRRGDE